MIITQKDRALVLFGSLKLSKIHPFHIILYFFGLKGLYDEKGLLEFHFRPFLDSLKLKKDQVVFVVKLVKTDSDKLVHRHKNEFHCH